MWKLDLLLMNLSKRMTYRFEKFLYFFMFRDFKNCREFCPTCRMYEQCVENVKQIHRMNHDLWK